MLTKTKWHVTADFQEPAAREAFGSLESVFALSGEKITKDKQSSVMKLSVENQDFYVKRYYKASGIRSWIGRSRLRLEIRNQLWFDQIGLPAAKVVAYGEKCVGLKTIRGALVTKSQSGTKDFAWTACNRPELLKQKTWLLSIISQLAEITRTLHGYRFCHNDLKWRNLLVTQDPQTPKVYLIDCPTGQVWPKLFLQRRIVKDLACLDKVAKYQLTRTQRLKFYMEYRNINKLTVADKRLIHRVLGFFAGRE
jgi:tRNA A-37 threonylcarbamoyl transferase component Bud32